ncbi:MAG: NTP transferase domain-containing protein [Bernardetiaceae bacterium]|nr:NTP transferase domain-containing protein [Bernardetiaceae bacterium]
MKVLIPVAGAGKMLRPHTHTQPKPLVPVAGKPILGHIIDTLIGCGLTDFIFVIGYLGDKIEEFVHDNYGDTIQAEFVTQEPRQGSAHAIWVARKHILDEKNLLIMLGDTIVDMDFESFFENQHSVLAVKKVDNPCDFGIVELDKNRNVSKLVEKPRMPKSNYALVGLYKMNNVSLLLDSIQYILHHKKSNNGEYQLTDALMHMVSEGAIMQVAEVEKWYDCGKKDTLLEANAILLMHQEKSACPQLDGCIIIPPVSFGKDCRIEGSIIGPNVAIGDFTNVQNSIIKNTIIGSFSEIENAVLNHSIVGSDSSLRGLKQSLNIGDSTEINFGN